MPCEVAIAKIRNGSRIDIGSRPRPAMPSRPSVHSTASSAQPSGSRVSASEPTSHQISSAVVARAMPNSSSTPRAAAAMSPIALAKPMMWMSTRSSTKGARIACSSCRATVSWSRRSPDAGSRSSSSALIRAAPKSSATSRPARSALRMFWRTRARLSAVGRKSAGTTLPPAKPPSTISTKRTFGVSSERTELRSTPGRKKTASVTRSSAVKKSGVKMSPSRARTAISRRSPPPKSARYSRKVAM